jgi:hypothetical protein
LLPLRQQLRLDSMDGGSRTISIVWLTRAIQAEFYSLTKLGRLPGLQKLVDPLFRPLVHRFADIAIEFESRVAAFGMRDASKALLPQFIQSIETVGIDNLPPKGPLLIVSNHPGAYDAFILASLLPRDDLRLISSDISILSCLPATSDRFIMVTTDTYQRMAAVREAVYHLRRGGALLLFPSGMVDPDPDSNPGACEAIDNWSPSLELFLRRVPDIQVVLATISGVLSKRWSRSPVTWLRKEQKRRLAVAEVFQILQQLLFPGSLRLRSRITFSRSLSTAEIPTEQGSKRLLPGLISLAHEQLSLHMSWPEGLEGTLLIPTPTLPPH